MKVITKYGEIRDSLIMTPEIMKNTLNHKGNYMYRPLGGVSDTVVAFSNTTIASTGLVNNDIYMKPFRTPPEGLMINAAAITSTSAYSGTEVQVGIAIYENAGAGQMVPSGLLHDFGIISFTSSSAGDFEETVSGIFLPGRQVYWTALKEISGNYNFVYRTSSISYMRSPLIGTTITSQNSQTRNYLWGYKTNDSGSWPPDPAPSMSGWTVVTNTAFMPEWFYR